MITPMKSRIRCVSVCGCLLIFLAFAGLAVAQDAGAAEASLKAAEASQIAAEARRKKAKASQIAAAKQKAADARQKKVEARQKNVVELGDCLGGLLSRETALITGANLGKMTKNYADQIEMSCEARQVGEYSANDFASYAMGVSLQRKLLSQHDSLNWVDFINGLLRANSSTVRVSSARITAKLEKTLLGNAEASQQYLDENSESKGVKQMQGVFVRKLYEAAGSENEDSTFRDVGASSDSASEEVRENRKASVSIPEFADDMQKCEDDRNADEQQLQIKFYLVKPIDRKIESMGIVGDEIRCIAYQTDDVIRGWRLIVDKLEKLVIYDVLIPSELAYGATGVPGMVEGDENLRFLMQVVELE